MGLEGLPQNLLYRPASFSACRERNAAETFIEINSATITAT